ncbi:MAG TPA: hypothetical protein VFH50_00020 [Acidimicrobiales bacterium]|nr:hypothetical protein [Acidimicrobiales bacterium]
MAVSAVAASAAVTLWPGLAWAYGNFPPPPPSGGGGGGGSGLPGPPGHHGGAHNDSPPMGVTNDRPKAGSSETVSNSATACVPGSPVTVALTFVAPTSTPASFGSTTVDNSGSFSVTGTIPSNANPGVWVIFATCNDAGGNTNVYTATIVVLPAQAGSGLRSAQAGRAVPASGATQSHVAGGVGSGGAAAGGSPASAAAVGGSAADPGSSNWSPPATWGTPALRALVAPAVSAAAASAPVVLAVGSHPVVAHTTGALGSSAPWRDGVEGLAGLVGLTGLVRLQRRHQHRRRNRWNSRRRTSHGSHRRPSAMRRIFGTKPRGQW